jgi:thymidine kinase
MAHLHPSFPTQTSSGIGVIRERQILQTLELGLPASFDLFHNLPWSVVYEGTQHIGECDIAVVAPSGCILLLEVKAGALVESGSKLTKMYGGTEKNAIGQVRRQHASLLGRIKQGDLPKVHVGSMLVLPDYKVASEVLSYPSERIVDATRIDQLCTLVQQSFPATEWLNDADRQRVMDFLSNRFNVVPDVSTHIAHVQQANALLASGMAQWVPHVQHPQGVYVIEATAGSGKTQLALGLLQRAASNQHKARYVCFNRPLADHLGQLAPAVADVTTFHQLCREHAQRVGFALDFASPQVFDQMSTQYVQDADQLSANLDLLIIDESQDFDSAWVQALSGCLKPDGQLYVMGDPTQKLYERDSFDLPDAVHIQCMDNFRSPRAVVREINDMGLTPLPIEARSAYEGTTPTVHLYGPQHGDHLTVLNRCLQQLWADGYQPEQVVVLSYNGVKTAQVLSQHELGGFATRKFTGQYDNAGNPCWSEGRLLVESVYRFKGQSAPVVVLCEVAFDELTDKDKRKLFVGLTRAQHRVELVMLDETTTQ